jgi:hypothetical protein
MKTLSLAEAVEFATLGRELHLAFLELDKVPSGEQVKGNPVHDRWREFALRFSAIRGWRKCDRCDRYLDDEDAIRR